MIPPPAGFGFDINLCNEHYRNPACGGFGFAEPRVSTYPKDLDAGLVKFGWVTVPIPMPLRMELILLDSILLVLGTTLYKLFCPDTIQEFSEVQWVSQHHQPRLIYFREMWRKWWLVWPTGIFSISGALLALYLIGERILMAAKYLLNFGW